MNPEEKDNQFVIPYKHVLIFTVFVCWYGPSTMIFNLVLLSILFGPNKVFPVLREVVKRVIDESKQLYTIATKDENEQFSSLNLFAKVIRKRFYDTL
jgi:hypothetical protein